tara:strand:+ start:109 stop:633 length:525 start_codon:yes stop_codon:yes gene_type:complete
MGQEFFINSQELESKIRQLLPSQGGKGAGFDLSASTQIVPIVDLTESAEGSNLRQDLQSSFSFDSCTSFDINNATNQTIISNTGYWRVYAVGSMRITTGDASISFSINDGATTKQLVELLGHNSSTVNNQEVLFDFIVKLTAGDSLLGTANYNGATLAGNFRQIANIDGELTNP